MNRSIASVAMATSLLLLTGFVWSGSEAAGQSILKRLESEIRQRVAEDSATKGATALSQRPPGYLGAVVDDREDRGRGVRVLDVRPGGPADLAGLHVGDLVTGVAGVRVRQTEDLADIMAVFPEGSRVALDVLREGNTEKIDVVLGRRESPADVPLPLPEAVPLPEPSADPGVAATQPAPSQPQAVPSMPGEASPDVPPAPPSSAGPAMPSPEVDSGSQPAPSTDSGEIQLLRARIAELERRVEALEKALADAPRLQ